MVFNYVRKHDFLQVGVCIRPYKFKQRIINPSLTMHFKTWFRMELIRVVEEGRVECTYCLSHRNL